MSNLYRLLTENNHNTIELDEKFFIKNIDTGEIYHFQNDDSYQKIFAKINPLQPKAILSSLSPEIIWEDYWKEVRRNREKFWDACEMGDLQGLLALISMLKSSHTPIDINDRTLNNYTGLHLACENGHEKVAQILLSSNANISAITSFGRTPLHLACIKGSLSLVQLLLASGAPLEALDEEQNTPLHMAAELNNLEIISELLKRNPGLEVRNYQGMKAYDLCLDMKARRLFELYAKENLLDLKSYYSRTEIGDTILNNGRKDHVERLLLLGAKNRKLVTSEMLTNKLNVPMNYSKDFINPFPLYKIEENKNEDIINESSPKHLKKKDIKQNKAILEERLLGLSQESFKCDKKPDIVMKSHLPRFLNYFSKPENSLIKKVGLEDFLFYKLLGKGSFGEVFLVKEKHGYNRFFAMKVLNKDKVFSQNLVKYVKSERNILSLMNHPFIVKLNFAFQTQNKLFLILDYCPGGDLGQVLCKKRRFAETIVRIYISEIILGIEALHSKNIIFRDLKPDNVVLDSEGHALLTDFGLSRQGIDTNITKSFCGSVAYLAPEMLTKVGHNKTIDWYLVGVLFYELLVGIPPFFSKNRDEMFHNIKSGPLLVPKNLTSEAKDLMKRLLCRNPMNRLGASSGAIEVKTHPFFKQIQWEEVYKRKLKPPVVELKDIGEVNEELTKQCLWSYQEENKGNSQNYIEGWSYDEKRLL